MPFQRSQFTFYDSFYKSIEALPTSKQKLEAYRLVCSYALYGEIPNLETAKTGVLSVFHIVKPILDTARQRAQNGKKGGMA